MQSAVAVLGVPITRPRVAAMFHEADTDGSGQIDCARVARIGSAPIIPPSRSLFLIAHPAPSLFAVDEFCAVIHQGDGGAFARLIQRVAEDRKLRGMVKERVRPSDRAERLEDQLAAVRAQREWISGLHLNSVAAAVDAGKAGYTDDHSIFLGPAKEPAAAAAQSSPTSVRAVLSPRRTARPMLPPADDGLSVQVSHLSPPSLRSPRQQQQQQQQPGSPLRKIWAVQAPVVGRSVSVPMRRH